MTKERLEELIKQGATIWYGRCRWGSPIKLDTVHFVIVNDRLYYQKNKKRIGDGWELKELREDVDRGKWEHKMFLSRTERFEPPMWNEIEDKYSFMFADCNDCVVRFSVFKNYHSINHIVVYKNFTDENVFYEPATKENYEKACEIVRDLFMGANNG